MRFLVFSRGEVVARRACEVTCVLTDSVLNLGGSVPHSGACSSLKKPMLLQTSASAEDEGDGSMQMGGHAKQ
eukprot:3152298-Rhodomonas_salina.2